MLLLFRIHKDFSQSHLPTPLSFSAVLHGDAYRCATCHVILPIDRTSVFTNACKLELPDYVTGWFKPTTMRRSSRLPQKNKSMPPRPCAFLQLSGWISSGLRSATQLSSSGHPSRKDPNLACSITWVTQQNASPSYLRSLPQAPSNCISSLIFESCMMAAEANQVPERTYHMGKEIIYGTSCFSGIPPLIMYHFARKWLEGDSTKSDVLTSVRSKACLLTHLLAPSWINLSLNQKSGQLYCQFALRSSQTFKSAPG